jgi:NAD(P)-dependent dehydrogenase (short-subunit alcohol dehydrogenase family)
VESLADDQRAIVIGAGGGIGRALAAAMDGIAVTRLGRNSEPPVVLEDEASIAAAALQLAARGPYHLIVDATGALTVDGSKPEKRLADLDPAVMARAFWINAIGPALLFKHFAALLPRSGRCVFATLSARVGSIGDNRLGGWVSYRASKAALNQMVRCAAIEIARGRPEAVVLALHPNTVRTGLSAPFTKPGQGITPAESAALLLRVMRTATESGAFLDYDGRTIPW